MRHCRAYTLANCLIFLLIELKYETNCLTDFTKRLIRPRGPRRPRGTLKMDKNQTSGPNHQVPDHTAVRVALWRAMHVQVDPPPHILVDEIGLQLIAPDQSW